MTQRERAAILCVALLAACSKAKSSASSRSEAAVAGCEQVGRQTIALEALCTAATPRWKDASLASMQGGCAQLGDVVASGTLGFDPAAAASCAAAYAQGVASADCTETAPPASCAHVTYGRIASGRPCNSDDECTTGWCDFSATTPICKVPGAEGDPCEGGRVGDNPSCGPGLFCEGFSTESCVLAYPPGASGDPCPPSYACAAGLYCDLWLSTPTCVPLGLPGSACHGDGGCTPGLTCGPADVCASWIGAGADCTSTQTACGNGLYCGSGGTCVELPLVGASCADSGSCWEGFCSTPEQICKPLRPNGALCDSYEQCQSGSCASGLCTP
jgi:hypothetical protein